MVKTKNRTRITAITACSMLLAGSLAGGFAALPAGAAASANTYNVDLQKTLQTFDGWGLSLSWWATEIGDWTRMGSTGKEKREELMEAIYGESGLNLNIARYNVGGGDDPTHTHMTDDRNTPGWKGATATGSGYTPNSRYYFQDVNGNDIDWQNLATANPNDRTDVRQLWVLDWIQNEHGVNGDDDLITEFYSNSPPYWMTIAGCSSGGAGAGQNLDPSKNKEFADYFLDVYEYLVRQGFTFDNLQPFNESGSYYWGTNGDQEGCYFSAQQKIDVLSYLIQGMQERGIDIAYNWGDETDVKSSQSGKHTAQDEYNKARGLNTSTNGVQGMKGSDIVDGAGRLTYHIYSYDVAGTQEMYRYAKSHGQQVYMSEITWTDGDDYDPDDMQTGFHYVQSIVDTVKYGGVDAFVFWQGMEDMLGQMKSHTNYGLIQGVYATQEEAEAQGYDLAAMGLNYQDFILAKAYYLSGQYTKYIRPGYTIIDVDDNDGLAAVSPDGTTLVYVKRNEGTSSNSFKLNFGDFKAKSVERVTTNKTQNWATSYLSTDGSSLVDVVDGSSVTTYIIKGENTKGNGHIIDQAAAQYQASLSAIETELAQKGDVEALYATFESKDNGGFYSNQNRYSGEECYMVFRFKGTGYGLSFVQKNDSGKISVWVDKPTSEEPDQTAELYSATRIDKAIVLRKNDLDEGWHTVIVKGEADSSGHKWINFYGAFVYTSIDKAPSNRSLNLTSAAGVGNTVKFTLEKQGLDDYDIYPEYRTGATDWVRGESKIEGNSGTVEVSNAKSVRLRLVAVKDGAENEYSAEKIVNLLPATSGVLYYVDAGTADPSALAAGAVLGVNQSVSDQPYGADPYTGLNWGYTGSTKADKSGLGYYETYEAMTSMMSTEVVDKIEYTFTIPTAGTYKVTLGFFGGESSWGDREIKATVKGSEQSFTLKGGDYKALYFTVTTSGANEEITVTVTNDTNNAQLSAIVITDNSTSIPLYTSGNSNYNSVGDAEEISVGADITANAEAKSFTVYYSGSAEQTATINKESAKIVVDAGTIVAGTEASATFYPTASEFSGLEPFVLYQWKGAGELYYNIDMAFTGNGTDSDRATTPPDDTAGLIGSKQSTTHDRVYGKDGNTEWGYVGNNYNNGLSWVDNKENKWSIREGKDSTDGKASLTYKMTGFISGELLKLGVAGHCSTWSTRSYDVIANGETVGTVTLTSGANPIEVTFTGARADEKGELTVIFKQKSGDGPQVGYLKVWSDNGEVAPTITADKSTVGRGDSLNLRNLVEGATVYVLDENGILFDSFKAAGNSQEYTVNKLPATSYELHFLQAVEGGATLSEELVVDVPGVDIVQQTEIVKNGEATVILFTPHALNGVTSLTVDTPYGVTVDVSDGFFFRARANGEYKVTIVSNKVTYSTTFTVDNIDAVDFGEEISETGWTADPVTVTLNIKTEEWSGIESLTVNGEAKEGEAGVYTFTAEENGEFTVELKTKAGFTYTKVISINNIDTTEPELELNFNVNVAAGVTLSGSATTQSGGTLYVTYNGEAKAVPDLSSISLVEAGKYEIYFVSGTGKETAKVIYYVTYGVENAQLATVTIGEDGTVTSSESAKLYRAGESTEITSKKAEKAGRYYLEITKDGETEIIVFTIAVETSGSETPGETPPSTTTPTTPTTPKKNNSAIMISGIVVGVVAIVAAAVVCTMLYLKGRKKS